MSGPFTPSRSAGSRALRRGGGGRGWMIGLGIAAALLIAQQGGSIPGGRIAYIAADGESGDFDIYLIDLDDGVDPKEREPTLLFASNEIDAEPEWSPDGQRIVFVSDEDILRMDVSADGAASNVVKLTDSPAAIDQGPVYSPVCQTFIGNCRNWIAFFSATSQGSWELYLMDEDGNDRIQLTDDDWLDYWPTWSPDGRKLAFMSDRSGTGFFDIYTLDIGSGKITQLTNTPFNDDVWPAWSPNGSTIAWSTDMETGWFRIWLMDADCEADCQEEARLLVDDDFEFGVHEFDANWSPDGRWVVFSTYRDPEAEFGTQFDYEIFAAQAYGTGLVQITYNDLRDDFTPAWTR